MGIARLLLAGLAVLLVLGLIVLGVISLIGSLSGDDEPSSVPTPSVSASTGTADAGSPPPAAVSTSAPDAGGEVPTLFVRCQADTCPLFVRVTGGDVIEDRDLGRGQQAAYTQPSLEVVLGDASTMYVEVNGKARPLGKPGQKQTFTAKRDSTP